MVGCRADQLEIKDRRFTSIFEPRKTIEWEKVVEAYTNSVGPASVISLPPGLKGLTSAVA